MRLALTRPWRVLAAFLVLGVGGGLLASRLEFRGSFVELLPEGAREVQDLTRVSQKAGGDGYLVLRARGAAPDALRAFAVELQGRLEALPNVRYVEHRYDVGFFKRHGLLLMPTEQLRALYAELSARLRYERQQVNPFYVELVKTQPPPSFDEIKAKYTAAPPVKEYLASADGSEVYLMIKPAGTAGDLGFARQFVEEAKAVAATVAKGYPGVEVDATGNFQSRIEEDAVMRQDLARSGLLSALLAAGLILLATRRLSALAVVGLPVMVGVILTFAFAQLAIGHLNVVTGFLVAILIGLGIEYGVHLSMRYWEERQRQDVPEALAAAVRGTFAGAITSAVTNAAAFFVLMFAQFHAFNQFGLLAGMGVLLAVLVTYGLGPSLLAIAERLRPNRARAATVSEGARPSTPERSGRRWPTPIISGVALAVLAFASFSAIVSPQLGFETDMRKLKGDSPSSRLDDHITTQLGAPLNPAILLVKDLEEARVVRDLISEVQARHGADSVFLRSTSLVDLLPSDLENRQKELQRLRELVANVPESFDDDPRLTVFKYLLKAQPYGLNELPVEARRRFEALDGQGMFLLLFPSVSNYDTRDLHRWAAQLDEVVEGARGRNIDLSVLDSNRIASRIFALVRGDGPFILGAAAVVVFLAIFASLRSLKRALLVAGPLFLGMVCLAGGMYLFDVQLNFINAVVLPNLLAIAVDNSVHLFHRYEEEGPGSLGKVVRHTGLAAVVATLSNAAGYGALLVASHQGLRSIGQIALLGVVCTFLGTTIFFPALLALIERWKARGVEGAGEGAVVRSLEIDATRAHGEAAEERKSA
ncbi:efflux RND transporter permease subunit [Hyalangium rubrum]|uniref:MMPL family transporter n=1 Tax=Hyalangium rubrum TaxID=3103134 RepID=A0ABU5HHL9_9BACT|nr:MMPL family transporter [Hyalangium sp. s54d21]MDY7232856.1 MMPL family transporter [Hyalangium sp. s54d21]